VVAAVLAVVVATGGLVMVAPSPVAAADAVFKEDVWVLGPNVDAQAQNQVVYGRTQEVRTGPFRGSYVLGDLGDWEVPIVGQFEALPPRGPGTAAYYYRNRLPWTVTVAGATGVVASDLGAGRISVLCQNPDLIDPEPFTPDYCSIPSGTYQVTINWAYLVQDGPCVRAQMTDPSRVCPDLTVSGTATRTILPGSPENQAPTAAFDATPSPADPLEVSFVSRSTDPDSPGGSVAHRWDFGDGTTSEEWNPTHIYPGPGSYVVTLVVTDAGGLTSTTSSTVSLETDLVVNSSGDGSAQDPGEGCDTGGTVGDPAVPECTLRAAIEVFNEKGGGEIGFDIEGGGVPSIAVASALPSVTAPITIDGTTQPGAGRVEVTGSADTGLVLAGGTSTVTGMVVNGFASGIQVTGGSDHSIEGNVVGLDAAGVTDRGGAFGVEVTAGAGVTVDDNVIGSETGVIGFPATSGLEVTNNTIGVGSNGAALGSTKAAVLVGGPNVTVSGNTVHGTTVGVMVLRAAASNAAVFDNQVGLSSSGVPFESMGYGIRIDGAPGATVQDNDVVSDAYGAIAVSGSDQTLEVGDELQLLGPDDDVQEGAVTGGGATITGNTVAVAGGAVAGDSDNGIVSWAGAADLKVLNNVVGGVSHVGIELTEGSGHRVAGNTIGSAAVPAGEGVEVTDAATATIGGPADAGNTITATDHGVTVSGDSPNARIEGNTVTGSGDYTEYVGIDVPSSEASGATVTANTVIAGYTGIGVKAPEATVSGNRTTDQTEVGIYSFSFDSTVTQNVVTGAGLFGIGSVANKANVTKNTVNDSAVGIVASGSDVTVAENRVGLAEGPSTVVGNDGRGMVIESGDVLVSKNLVAGSDDIGIQVDASADAELRANRVWQSTDLPIAVDDGPAAPTLAAAIRSGSGDTLQRTLLIGGLPEGDAGTIEVFANSTCGGDGGEAEFLMEITRTKGADEQNRIIQVRETPTRDHFTLTYTDTKGRTSELSNCVSGATHPDGDGDGSVDPLDAIVDADDDPTTAIVATDNEQLLLLKVAPYDAETDDGGGEFESIAATDDPAPSSHPAGWGLTYGALSFRISNVKPGGHTTVFMTTLSGSDAIAGTSYWKYGPQATGGAAAWYPFDYDEATDTGATLSDATNIPGVGIRRAFLLRFADGVRGDSDGGVNGTITDPGGPVLYQADPAEPPATTAPVPTTTAPVPTTAPAPAPTGSPDQTATASGTDELPRTGSTVTDAIPLGIALLLGGIAMLAGRRRLHTRLG
jgi:LPXTG-motif cell wall-anchored protein